jgi:hypothetical protein
MHVDLTTGQDSFRASGTNNVRNVSVRLFTATEEGIQPLFVAMLKKLKGFKDSKTILSIPASDKFAVNDNTGVWYKTRYEIAPATEILVQYTHKAPTGGFSQSTEYLLLRVSPEAALNLIRLELPAHPLSSVPYVFFEGRMDPLSSAKESGHIKLWNEFVGMPVGNDLTDIVDGNMLEDRFFTVTEIEAASNKPNVAQIVSSGGKKKISRIKRSRRINTR